MRFKKFLCAFLCLAFVLPCALAAEPSPADAAPVEGIAEPVPGIVAPYVALYCPETDQLLLGKNAETAARPASITKIMTALLVLEHVSDLTETTTVSDTAVHSIERNSTHIALDTGEVVTIGDLLAAALVESANDASNVLAEYVAGSLAAFSDMMNEKAAELGCTNTHFSNAHGLDADDHLVSAHDMARITAAALQYPDFIKYAGATTYTMPPTNKQKEPRSWGTKQNMLLKSSKWYDPAVIAGKNGYTLKAHQTLVTVKRQNGITLIAVSMGATDTKANCLKDTASMFAYGYDQLHRVALSAEQQAKEAVSAFSRTDTSALEERTFLLPLDKTLSDLTLSAQGESSDAPVLSVTLGDYAVATIPLTMRADAPSKTTLQEDPAVPAVSTAKSSPSVLSVLLGILGVIVVIFLVLVLYRNHRIHRQRSRIRAMRMRNRK